MTYAKGSRYPQSSIKPILPIPSLGPNPVKKTRHEWVWVRITYRYTTLMVNVMDVMILFQSLPSTYLRSMCMCHRYGHTTLSQNTPMSLSSLQLILTH